MVGIGGRNYFHKAVKDVASEEVIFELKLERNKGGSHLQVWEMSNDGRGKSTYKGRESLPCSRKSNKVRPKRLGEMVNEFAEISKG